MNPQVLILVVVDNGLVLLRELLLRSRSFVLILVVVDNGLVHDKKKYRIERNKS